MYRFTPEGLRYTRANAPSPIPDNLGRVALELGQR